MDLNFDYREFQRDTMERLAKIYAESYDQNDEFDESDETFNKIQKILDCQLMEKCHPYLYTLDREHVNEADKKKIDELYECGIKRGILQDTPDDSECNNCCGDDCDGSLCGGPSDSLTGIGMNTQDAVRDATPAFTVLYSASKDGSGIKTGEFYSQATDKDGARMDCTNSLAQAGYSNVNVLAIEQNANGVDTNVIDNTEGGNLYGMYEDDSEEYEKQETGDDSKTEKKDSKPENGGSSEDSGPSFGGGVDSDDNGEQDGDSSSEDTSADNDGDNGNEKDDTESGETANSEEEQKKDSSSDGNSDGGQSGEQENDDAGDSEKDNSGDDGKTDSEDGDKDEKKLTPTEKSELKDEYTKVFKQVLPKISTEKSVSEFTIQEKIDFLTKLSEKWTKNDPVEFLQDKDQEKLNKYVAKPEEKAK